MFEPIRGVAREPVVTTVPVLRVAVAAPLRMLFDYLPPPGADGVRPGCRVLVPFGHGRRVGLVVATAAVSDQAPERLKPVLAVLDAQPLLSALDLRLLLWAADYYQAPPGEVLFAAWPARLRRVTLAPDPRRAGWRLTATGRAQDPAQLAHAPRQAAALRALAACPEGLELAALRAVAGDCAAALRALADKGLAERCRLAPPVSVDEPAPSESAPPAPPALNTEQAVAVAAVAAALGQGFACFLLDGVTGSGKTEVYIQLIGQVLAAGGQVLVLVPEIGLTPQLAARLRRRLAVPMALLHSALDDPAREAAWQAAVSGDARLLLGTRSAVFTPLPALGLIIVDEEHDQSFQQQDGFRYSARDLAVRRAQLTGCPILLGSATPALESLHNARLGRYRHLHLTRRAGAAADPRILLVDIRAQPLDTGLSHALLARMDQEIIAGNQVLLFLNRRGFAPVLTCHDCGWVSDCSHCDARMTLHRDHGELICHHCGASARLPPQCPYCTSPDLRPLGQGTERVEDRLRRRFPGIPLARIDRDSTRRRGELERLLAAARRGEYPLLLGTQMLAKGHHLPGITLVGILELDHGLYSADFRAPERMAQLLIQVAGRAGRAERPGIVLVQTRHPRHPLLVRLLREGYGSFAAAALAERAEARLPPFTQQALVRADSPEEQAALGFLREVRGLAAALIAADPDAGVELWGPAPASMERRAGRVRAQLLLQAPRRAPLQALLNALLPRLLALPRPRGLRWGVDVDPRDPF